MTLIELIEQLQVLQAEGRKNVFIKDFENGRTLRVSCIDVDEDGDAIIIPE